MSYMNTDSPDKSCIPPEEYFAISDDINLYQQGSAPLYNPMPDISTSGNANNASDYLLFEFNLDNKSYMVSAKNKESLPTIITIPKEYNGLPVTCIKSDGFSSCYNLSIVLFEDNSNIDTIGSYAFLGCTHIESIELPISIKKIQNGAFHSCFGLQQMYLPSKTPPRLGKKAFYQTSEFLNIYVPHNSISGYKIAFGWSDYKNRILSLPCPVPCNLAYFNFTLNQDEESYTLTAKDITIIPETLVIPSHYNRKPVSIIGKDAFSHIVIRKVYFPKTIERIEERAFVHTVFRIFPDGVRSTSLLEKVAFEKGSKLKFIGKSAFSGNCHLCKVLLPKELIELGPYSFFACHFSSVHIPKKVASIGDDSFSLIITLEKFTVDKNNTNYKTIDGVLYSKDGTILVSYPSANEDYCYSIPDIVKFICGISCFTLCQNLRVLYLDPINPPAVRNQLSTGLKGFKIYVPTESYELYKNNEDWSYSLSILYPKSIIKSGLAILNNTLIQYVENNSEITLPDDITEIANDALAACTNLKNVYVTEQNTSFQSINGVLFNKDMTKLLCYPPAKPEEQYEIPDTVTTLGVSSFFRCNHLLRVYTRKSLETIEGYSFMQCYNLKELINLDAKDNIKIIGTYAFYECTSVEEVTLSSVETIASVTFGSCYKLRKVTLGKNINSILYYLFCSYNYEMSVEKLLIYATIPPIISSFWPNVPKAIYVLPDCLDAYKNAANWSQYRDIIYPMTQTIMQ